jgi:hypothetical protein
MDFDSNATVNDDIWHHAVLTWEPNNALMYIDGVQQTATDTSNTLNLLADDELYI